MAQNTVGIAPEDNICLRGPKGVTLHPRHISEASLYAKWINDEKVNQYLAYRPPMTVGMEEEWVEKAGQDSGSIIFVIRVDGKPIGTMGTHDINWIARTATTGALIGETEYWGKGYGTIAKMILLNYLFNTVGLRKVKSSVIAFNKRSEAYSLNCGYKREGLRKQEFFRKGRYYDEILMAVFREDWIKKWRLFKKQHRW